MKTILLLILSVILTQVEKEGKLLTVQDITINKEYSLRTLTYEQIAQNLNLKPELSKEDCSAWLPKDSDDIIYGESVSRNEFGIDKGIFPSPDNSRIAFYRKDQSAVSRFPLLDISTRTGCAKPIAYPMIGMASEKIDLGIYDTNTKQIVYAQVSDFSPERYLTCISWSNDSRYVFIQVLDRSQHDMHLNMYDAADGSFIKTILTEHNDAWVEPQEPLHFISDREFLYSTDNRDGYKSIYLCDLEGNLRRLTRMDADAAFEHLDNTNLYFTANSPSPAEQQLYCVNLKTGRIKRLSSERGWHNITFGENSYIDCFSSFENPGWTRKYDLKGRMLESLIECQNPYDGVAFPEMEFGYVPTADGSNVNHYRFIKPANFDPEKKYPLIVYVYGGPHLELVRDAFCAYLRKWELLMAQKGYAVYVQDNRGVPNHGTAYEKAINRQCGKVESEDQFAGIDALLERCPWIDRERIGIHGWSYGGFMTLTMATDRPDFFKVAALGGPVTDWKWYEVMYGERYMDTPQTNPDGFHQTSIMNRLDSLKAKTIIFQGAVDPTVVWIQSLSLVQECINKGIDIDYFPFPSSEHNMYGKERVYLYNKITDWFVNNL